MADEYIRRADAVDAVKHAWAKGIEPSQYIESLEPADVVPVVYAHWKDNKNGTVSCSRCSTWFQKEREPYLRFCGYCGAKMDIEE